MKSLRQIVELKKIDLTPDPELQAGQVSNYASPKSDAEKNFVGKHKDNIQTALHPAFKNEAEQDAVFKGGSIQKDKTKISGYTDGDDAEVYEQAIIFVRDNLTEDNLQAFDELAKSNPEAAVEFAMEMVEELTEEE